MLEMLITLPFVASRCGIAIWVRYMTELTLVFMCQSQSSGVMSASFRSNFPAPALFTRTPSRPPSISIPSFMSSLHPSSCGNGMVIKLGL